MARNINNTLQKRGDQLPSFFDKDWLIVYHIEKEVEAVNRKGVDNFVAKI